MWTWNNACIIFKTRYFSFDWSCCFPSAQHLCKSESLFSVVGSFLFSNCRLFYLKSDLSLTKGVGIRFEPHRKTMVLRSTSRSWSGANLLYIILLICFCVDLDELLRAILWVGKGREQIIFWNIPFKVCYLVTGM